MASPRSKDARLFYRCATQRYKEAQILIGKNHTTGAVYLAGYGIECILKALVLSVVPYGRVSSILNSFRGFRAHDFEWLREQYYENKGARLPRNVIQNLALASYWSTNLRYNPANMKLGDAKDFLAAVDVIIAWANGRL